ncbi:MAG: hypothetical protein PHY47_04020 [Lachnospiraceae bacterium]|nr:hypothetical protein [Lachnospiraceae bacterium]
MSRETKDERIIYNKIIDFIMSVSKWEDGVSDSEKENRYIQLLSDMEIIFMSNNSSIDNDIVIIFFEELLYKFVRLNDIQKEKMILILYRYNLLYDMSYLIFSNYDGILYDQVVFDFEKSIESYSINIRIHFLSQLSILCSNRVKMNIQELCRNNISNIKCETIYYAILSGVLKYDQVVYERMRNLIFETPDIIKNVINLRNPIYVIFKLHMFGFIQNINDFKKIDINNTMFSYILNPYEFDYNLFVYEWWPFLLNSRYLESALRACRGQNMINMEKIFKKCKLN